MKLQTQHLTIGYGNKKIQQNLSLQANAGDLICLIGINGAGKSTLLHTLAGLLKPITGEVLLNGKSVHALSNYERSTLFSLVLTDAIVVDKMSVYDLVAMGRLPYTNWLGYLSQNDKNIIYNSLQQVNLLHKKDAYISQISDGEKQRAIIAKALAQDTPLVLLDESTAHLDLPNRIEVMLLLRRLSVNTRKTFILSTHELDLALQMADKIWLMTTEGVQVGIPEDLMLSGIFQQVFGSNAYHFDENDGHCKINHIKGTLQVQINGENTAAKWLCKALIRCGIEVIPQADIVISAEEQGFEYKGKKIKTIEEVLNLLMYY